MADITSYFDEIAKEAFRRSTLGKKILATKKATQADDEVLEQLQVDGGYLVLLWRLLPDRIKKRFEGIVKTTQEQTLCD